MIFALCTHAPPGRARTDRLEAGAMRARPPGPKGSTRVWEWWSLPTRRSAIPSPLAACGVSQKILKSQRLINQQNFFGEISAADKSPKLCQRRLFEPGHLSALRQMWRPRDELRVLEANGGVGVRAPRKDNWPQGVNWKRRARSGDGRKFGRYPCYIRLGLPCRRQP